MSDLDRHSIDRRGFLKAGTQSFVGSALSGAAVLRAAQQGFDGEKPMIWDMHCHLTAPVETTPQARIANLMEYADRMGIDRVLVFLGMPPHAHNPTPEQLRKVNDQVLEAIEGWPGRAFGLAYVSPEHVGASLKEIDRCIRDGPMVGLKLWVAMRCDDEQIDSIVRRNAELDGIFFQHTWLKVTGNLPGESTPADVVQLAKRHPAVPLICGHAGGDWEIGIRTIRAFKNISLGLSGFDPTNGVGEMAVRELGAERIIYGSDAFGRSFASQLSKVMGANVPDAAKRLMLGENLQRMLTPILTRKGIHL